MIKLFISTLFCLCLSNANAQTFVTDWAAFKYPHWQVVIKKDSFQFLDKPVLGTMELKNETKADRSFVYYIFSEREEAISNSPGLAQKLEQWWIVQDCQTEGSIIPFSYKGYFYLISPCNGCKTDKDCIQLGMQVQKFIANEK